MSSDLVRRPIRTPWRVRWSMFRSSGLPAVTMIVSAALSVWIWSRVTAVGQAVGEVERVKVVLSSGVEGRVAYVDGPQVTMLQHVEEGDIVARLDDTLVKSQIAGARAELQLLNDQLRVATANAATTPDHFTALRTAMSAKEEHLAQLDLKLDSLAVRAPITGTVTEIHARPGQFVAAGFPIVEIAAEQGTNIVAFLRAEQRISPRKGMEVEIHTASNPYQPVYAKVENVAGQFDAVPARQLRDPKVPEWGVPVRITLPNDVSVRPGELVRVTFRSRPPAVANAVAVAKHHGADAKPAAQPR